MANPDVTHLDKQVTAAYNRLPIPENKCLVTYVWIDGTGEDLRGKTRTLNYIPKEPKDVPVWSYDGSSTYQSLGANSDTYLYPVAIYNDPFCPGNNKLVLCDTYKYDNTPTETNKRASCFKAAEASKHFEPWFGMEQEYYLLDQYKNPFGWPQTFYPAPQGPNYCAVGANKVYGRDILESTYRACLYAGIEISGSNAEVLLSQWEYQVGPCSGVDTADQIWMSRYILHRVAEDYGVVVTFDPKPVKGDWNGSGAHMNFSTKAMREENGIVAIEEAIEKLSKTHAEHIKVYDAHGGEDNKLRLSGRCETSDYYTFSWGVANRGASVRIGRTVAADKKGWLEDRRPSSNCDPYMVTEAILKTCCLNEGPQKCHLQCRVHNK